MATDKNNERVLKMSFASVYPMYAQKIEKKGRTIEELNEVIFWLTGYDEKSLQEILATSLTLGDFYRQAPALNPNAQLITGVICGVRVEEIKEPLVQQFRWLDKLVDELAKGKKMEKIFRKSSVFEWTEKGVAKP